MNKIVIEVDDSLFVRLWIMNLGDCDPKYVLGELDIFSEHVQGISFVKD